MQKSQSSQSEFSRQIFTGIVKLKVSIIKSKVFGKLLMPSNRKFEFSRINLSSKLFRPVLIEAMTYRIGHHSTSDDSSAYRSVDEVRYWDQKGHPIARFANYLKNKGYWSMEQEKEWKDASRKQVMEAFARAEKRPKPKWQEMFYDVYDDLPPHLQKQMTYMEDHLKTYGAEYPMQNYEK